MSDLPLEIQLSVRVSDGSFDARLNYPVSATAEQRNGIVASWLSSISAAVEATQRRAESHAPLKGQTK